MDLRHLNNIKIITKHYTILIAFHFLVLILPILFKTKPTHLEISFSQNSEKHDQNIEINEIKWL